MLHVQTCREQVREHPLKYYFKQQLPCEALGSTRETLQTDKRAPIDPLTHLQNQKKDQSNLELQSRKSALRIHLQYLLIHISNRHKQSGIRTWKDNCWIKKPCCSFNPLRIGLVDPSTNALVKSMCLVHVGHSNCTQFTQFSIGA